MSLHVWVSVYTTYCIYSYHIISQEYDLPCLPKSTYDCYIKSLSSHPLLQPLRNSPGLSLECHIGPDHTHAGVRSLLRQSQESWDRRKVWQSKSLRMKRLVWTSPHWSAKHFSTDHSEFFSHLRRMLWPRLTTIIIHTALRPPFGAAKPYYKHILTFLWMKSREIKPESWRLQNERAHKRKKLPFNHDSVRIMWK